MNEETVTTAQPQTVINLDRDILQSHVTAETLLAHFKTSPLLALWALICLIFRARILDSLARKLPVEPSTLLYRHDHLETLEKLSAKGQNIMATSELPAPWAETIIAYLPGIKGMAAGQAATLNVLPAPKPASWWAIISQSFKALRPHQWSKNILIFVPLVLAHRINDQQAILAAFIAFACFSLTASAIYILNDMLDLNQDRKHPVKRNRPFASGRLSVTAGGLLIPLCIGLSAWLASYLPTGFIVVLGLYVVVNLAYVFYLKSKLLVDVLALASAYTLRILGGERAIDVDLSFWLLAFSTFLFLSLALVKRYVELDTIEEEAGADNKRVMGRGYRRADLDMLSQMGVASGFSAVLVLALYVDGAGRLGLYKTPEFIWLVCPIVLYVIGRIWVLAKRRELPDDPVLFIIKDWRSHLMGAIVIAIMIMAKTVGYTL